ASVLDAERLLLYLSAVAAFLLLDRSQVTRFLFGLLAAISLVGVWALSLRAFGGPGSYDVASVSADATRRLAAPLGYSNALGLLAAIGIVLAVGLAVRLRRLAGAGRRWDRCPRARRAAIVAADHARRRDCGDLRGRDRARSCRRPGRRHSGVLPRGALRQGGPEPAPLQPLGEQPRSVLERRLAGLP